jgi:sodium/potassium-transporting ATPase subunit alpha
MTNVLFGLPQILSSFLMIIICTMTVSLMHPVLMSTSLTKTQDCAAATAIAYEKPEADVMNRPPRNAKKDRLVDWKLIVHAYGFIGVFQTVMSFTMSYWYCQKSGLSFSSLWFGFGSTPSNLTADEYSAILATASSIYFSNLVIMQWFNLMATRTRRLSIFQHPPAFNKLTQNYLLFPAILFALVIIFIFCYIPQLQVSPMPCLRQSVHLLTILQPIATSSQIPVEFFFLPMALGFGLLLLDEGRKWCVRKWPSGFLAKTAW